MNYSLEPAAGEDSSLEWPEPLARAPIPPPRTERDRSPPRSYDREEEPSESAAIRQARSRNPGISPWLFVMATALNTMVAAVLAVIITLGVVRQERTDIQRTNGQPRDLTPRDLAPRDMAPRDLA